MALSLIDIIFNCILNIYSYTTDNFSSFLSPKNLFFLQQTLSEKFTIWHIQRKNKCPWSTKPQLIHLQRSPIPQAQGPSQRRDGGLKDYKNQRTWILITRQCPVEMTGKLIKSQQQSAINKACIMSTIVDMPKWMNKSSQISTTKLRLIGNQRLLRNYQIIIFET